MCNKNSLYCTIHLNKNKPIHMQFSIAHTSWTAVFIAFSHAHLQMHFYGCAIVFVMNFGICCMLHSVRAKGAVFLPKLHLFSILFLPVWVLSSFWISKKVLQQTPCVCNQRFKIWSEKKIFWSIPPSKNKSGKGYVLF